MRTPPFLLGAGLLFWGWQAGHLIEGAVMAAVLEGARLAKARWDFTDEDFRRIWTFCALLLLASALFAFTSTGGPGDFRSFLQNPSFATEREAGNASARTVASLIRWLPMIFFLFVAAQAFSSREGIPPETISVILRLRWQKARRLGQALPPTRNVNISYPYFMMCLFAASFHSSEDETFYWNLCPLLAWALWPQRSRRFGWVMWTSALAAVMVLGVRTASIPAMRAENSALANSRAASTSRYWREEMEAPARTRARTAWSSGRVSLSTRSARFG